MCELLILHDLHQVNSVDWQSGYPAVTLFILNEWWFQVVEDDSEDMREEEIEDDKDDEKNNEENNGKNSPRVLDTDELMEVFRSFPLKTSNKTGIRTFGLVS